MIITDSRRMTPALCVVVKTPGPAAPAKGSGRQKPAFSALPLPQGTRRTKACVYPQPEFAAP
ncbi:MAG: hypothetical protein KIC51_05675 [Acetobacter sp.]|nr:hypothetical protein [Acetobacter sp.]